MQRAMPKEIIEQAKLYCEDTKRLVHELGTSVGRLLEEIKS